MGGFGSGRRAAQPTFDDGLKLPLGWLMRAGLVAPGRQSRGNLNWTYSPDGRHRASVGYEADLRDIDNAWLRLCYVTTSLDGTKLERNYRVRLIITVPPFGGRRWWFVCPITGRRAAKLYLPPGADRFASRHASRAAYQSQREDDLGRAQGREARIVAKLGATYERPGQPPPPRPRWMRHRTYNRLCDELNDSVEAQDVAFVAGAERLVSRLRGGNEGDTAGRSS